MECDTSLRACILRDIAISRLYFIFYHKILSRKKLRKVNMFTKAIYLTVPNACQKTRRDFTFAVETYRDER